MTELKRCPFCGGEAEITTGIPNFTGYFDLNVVECKKCHCQTGEFETRQQVIERWNTRTPEIVRCGECRHYTGDDISGQCGFCIYEERSVEENEHKS